MWGWMSGHVEVISILMKRGRRVIYSRGNTGRNARAGYFSLHLDFLFKLNEVCTQGCEEEGGSGGERWHAAEGPYFIFLVKVLFSATLKGKEKNAGRFAAECIILRAGHF